MGHIACRTLMLIRSSTFLCRMQAVKVSLTKILLGKKIVPINMPHQVNEIAVAVFNLIRIITTILIYSRGTK